MHKNNPMTVELAPIVLQGTPGPRASLPQSMKIKVLNAEADHDEPRQLVVAYDALEEGRQMMSWVAKYCMASDDQLHVVHYQVCNPDQLLR